MDLLLNLQFFPHTAIKFSLFTSPIQYQQDVIIIALIYTIVTSTDNGRDKHE